MRLSGLIALLIAIAAPCVAAQTPAAPPPAQEDEDLIDADRPGFADTSTVLRRGWVQLETGLQIEFRSAGDVSYDTLYVPTLLRFGLTDHLEARIEGNTFTSVSPAGSTPGVSGFAPFSFGAEFQVHEPEDIRHPGIGVIARVFPAWGGEFRSRRVAADVRLAVDWDFAPRLSLNPNIGVGRYENDGGGTFAAALFALTLTYQHTPRLSAFVDIGLQAPEQQDGKTGATVDGGVAYVIGRNVQIDASTGTRAFGETAPEPFIGFGISFRKQAWGR